MSSTGDTTRDALVVAAVDGIVAEGWQATGTRAVTARAGVPLGALNYHFGSKEALFRRAAVEQVRAMFATPWRVITSCASAAELVDGMIGWCRAPDVTPQQQVLLLEVLTQARRDPELATALDSAQAAYRLGVAGALHRLGVVPGPPDAPTPAAVELASAFTAHCNGLWLQYVAESGFPHEAATRQAARIWKSAFAGPG